MKSINLLFPIAFIIISYFMVTEKYFLVDMSNYDIFRQSFFVISALMVGGESINYLRKKKVESNKKKIMHIFSLASSAIFILANIFALIAY